MALDYEEFIAKLEVEDKELDKTEMKISEIPFQTEEMKTLEEFWENFIAKRLPDTKVAIAWHKLLMNYVDEDKVKNHVFLLRYGAQEGRRGLLTQTTKNYSFVYADNEPAACHYKLIMRGCVPTLDALAEAYQKRNFPPTAYQNFVSKKIREYYCADKENDGEKCYNEFLEKILLVPDIPTGKTTIDLEYKSSPQIKGLKKTKTPSQKTNLEQNEKAPKALAKIEKWSKVDSNISKVIRAFFAVEENGVASYSAMEKICIEKFEMSAESFKNKCSQLMRKKDTSDDGKVFDKNGDDVTVWKPIKEKLYKHFQ